MKGKDIGYVIFLGSIVFSGIFGCVDIGSDRRPDVDRDISNFVRRLRVEAFDLDGRFYVYPPPKLVQVSYNGTRGEYSYQNGELFVVISKVSPLELEFTIARAGWAKHTVYLDNEILVVIPMMNSSRTLYEGTYSVMHIPIPPMPTRLFPD